MPFRRLTTPTYYGGLPAGYGYINNGGGGTPAPADGAKASGTNVGTYFIAFGEDATSSNSNRANAALAENCDLLDDLFRTSQVVIRSVTWVLGAPTNQYAFSGSTEVYVGGSGESPAVVNDQYIRNGLFHLVDSSGNEVTVGSAVCQPTLIHNGSLINQVGVPADGFFTDPTVNLNVTLPAGTYTIYYLARRNAAEIIGNKPSEYLFEQVRTIEKVPNGREYRGVDDLYRRATVPDKTAPANWRGNDAALDTSGSGGWFVKDSFPLTAFVAPTGNSLAGTLDEEELECGAGFFVELRPGFFGTTNQHRNSAGSGFVVRGSARTDTASDPMLGDPGLFGFAHFTTRRSTSTSGGTTTHFLVGDPVTLSGDQATLGGSGAWYRNVSGSDRSGIVRNYDIIVLQQDSTGDYFYFTVGQIISATVATLRYLDGAHPNLSGAFTIVEWLSPLFYSSEAASAYYSGLGLSNTLPPQHAGVMIAETPGVRRPVSNASPRKYLRVFASDQSSASRAIAWGGFNELDPLGAGSVYDEISYLTADGGAVFNAATTFNAGVTVDAVLNFEKLLFDPSAVGYNVDDRIQIEYPTAASIKYFITALSSYVEASSSSNGTDRFLTMYQGGLRSFNAGKAAGVGNWIADNTSSPAYISGVSAPGGPVRYCKFDTSSSWATTGWDDLDAAVGIGYKYLIFAGSDTVTDLSGSGSGPWTIMARTAPSADDLKVTFPAARAGHLVEATASVCVFSDTANSFFAVKLMYQVNGGGWNDVPGSVKYQHIERAADSYSVTVVGIIELPGSGNLTNVEVGVYVLGESGSTFSFSAGTDVDSILRAKLYNLSSAGI